MSTLPPRDQWLSVENLELLAQCEQDFFIATGNGGQHRNKTQSAVRLVHKPSGVTVSATNSRQREVNRSEALDKLRLAIALGCRETPVIIPELPPPSMRQKILYPLFAARLLDLLHAHNYILSDTAAALQCSTGQLSRIITKSPELLQAVNRARVVLGHQPLKA